MKHGKHINHLKQLWRPDIEPKDPDGYICLNHNEAPFGYFDQGIENELHQLNIYPEPYPLYHELAEFLGVEREDILLTSGSEQGLRHVFETYLDYSDKVIYPNPTYGMIDVYVHLRRAECVKIEYGKDRKTDVQKITDSIDNKTKIVYLANPDNPVGCAYSIEEIEEIALQCRKYGVMLLLDEAYYYYYSLSTVEMIHKYENIIVSRTFSKAWGLAGIRAGFLIANTSVIHLLRKQKPMNELNSIAIALCRSVIKNTEIIDKNVQQVKKWKNIFESRDLLNMRYLKSEGNYILLQSDSIKESMEKFKTIKILPRTFEHECLYNCIRFSVSNDSIMKLIADTLSVN